MPNSIGSSSASIKLQKLVFENEKLASELVVANNELFSENKRLASELVLAEKELDFQQAEKRKRAEELVIADIELDFQQTEKGIRAAELISAKTDLAVETERCKHVSELNTLNERLTIQNGEMKKRVSELVIANKEKIELLAQLLQSQKLESLGTLAGGVAHDMNNVLGAILGLATAHMEIQPAGSPTYHAFETIYKAAIRGGKMVKSLLHFARQNPASEAELDLNDIIQDEVRLLERTTLAKVHLTTDLEPNLRPIYGDASALASALMNLCINAVDAMPNMGTITLKTRNGDNDLVEVMVEDTGTGMSKDVLERALDPFFTTKSAGKGTGLGLSLAHSTVMAHRGQMEIQSELGQGTRILMRFPACEAVAQPPKPVVNLRLKPPHKALSVILVDDDELVQSSTQTLLEYLGHTVTGVFSGEDALAKLEAGLHPDVVMLDINMPGLGGLGTLERLHALQPTLPILITTGKVDQNIINVIEKDRYCTLLSKPYSINELNEYLKSK